MRGPPRRSSSWRSPAGCASWVAPSRTRRVRGRRARRAGRSQRSSTVSLFVVRGDLFPRGEHHEEARVVTARQAHGRHPVREVLDAAQVEHAASRSRSTSTESSLRRSAHDAVGVESRESAVVGESDRACRPRRRRSAVRPLRRVRAEPPRSTRDRPASTSESRRRRLVVEPERRRLVALVVLVERAARKDVRAADEFAPTFRRSIRIS